MARSQSAASASLAELERTLGSPLFDRVGRRLPLNESGLTLLPAAAALLHRAWNEARTLRRLQAVAVPYRIASGPAPGRRC